jgi:hypothetical protein
VSDLRTAAMKSPAEAGWASQRKGVMRHRWRKREVSSTWRPASITAARALSGPRPRIVENSLSATPPVDNPNHAAPGGSSSRAGEPAPLSAHSIEERLDPQTANWR